MRTDEEILKDYNPGIIRTDEEILKDDSDVNKLILEVLLDIRRYLENMSDI